MYFKAIFTLLHKFGSEHAPEVPILTKRKNIYADDRIIKMGERLRELRKSQKLTISQLAEQIGLSDRMVSNYERGENAISLEFIIKIYESGVFEDRSLEELLRFFVVEIYT